MANKNKISTFTIKVNTDNGKVKIEGITKSFQKAENAYKKLDKAVASGSMGDQLDNLSKKAQQVSSASGGAAASVTEFGRVISDAPYGIRGVANNLSQLASNLALTAKKAGGLGGALKSLGSAFWGPLGILVAIQAGLALLEAWSMQSKEAAFSMSEVFGKSVTETSAKLMILKKTINDTELSFEEKKHVVGTAKQELADLGIQVRDNADDFDYLNVLLEENIKVMTKRAIAQGLLNTIQEQGNKRAEEETKTLQESLRWYEKAAITLGNWTGRYTANMMALENAFERRQDVIAGTEERTEKAFELLKKKLEDGDMYLNYLFGDDKSSRGGRRGRANRIFKQQLLDLENIILQNEKSLTLMSTRNEIERLEIQDDFAQQDIDRRLDTFKEKQKMRLDDYLLSIKGHQNEANLAAEAQEKYRFALIDAEMEAGEAKLAIRENYAKKIADKELEISMSVMGKRTDRELKRDMELFSMLDPMATDGGAADAQLENSRLERLRFLQKQLVGAEKGGNTQEIQNAQIALNDFNRELREADIQNEMDYYQNKRDIAMEYVGFLGQTSKLFSALAGENEKMQKAALIMEKSAATAKIIVQTQEAITARRAGNLMMAAQGPFGVEKAKLDKVPMAKDIARMKVGAALSIANIWATGWGRGNVKSAGGQGSGSGDRTFDFNLVGSTEQNQLAQTTAGQLDQPVQAFVVSSQITNQQQLDNQIQTDATFGD